MDPIAAEDSIAANILVTVVCGVVVAFYAGKRYNTPETNRLSTTRSLFLITGAGYICASLALFFILSEIVLKPGILPFLGLEQAKKVVATFSAPPVLAAVILTTLLPNTAVINAWDAWLLKRFQTWGSIPQGVRNLADAMTQNALPVTEANLSDLRAWISSDGDVPNELAIRVSADSAETSRGHLTRVLRLYNELEKLEEQPAYAQAFRARQDTWQAIRADFQVFAAQSQAFFVLFDQLTHLEGPAGQDAFKRAKDRYHYICRKLYGHLVEFLAQLLLIVEGSELRIENRLRSIGFCIQGPAYLPLPIGPFVFMGVVMIVAILGIVAVGRPPQSGPLPLVITAMLIGTTKTIGVLAAVLPKLRWNTFRPDSRGNLPFLAWLMSAGLAAVVALLIERAELMIAYTASAAFDFHTYPITPLAPETFAICLSIAIICDVDLSIGQGWTLRITEGMLCAAAMVATLFICLQLLNIPSTTEAQTSPWFPYAFSFSLGFVGGLVAPYLYRRQRGEETQIQTMATRAV
jgi:hypothetical protein